MGLGHQRRGRGQVLWGSGRLECGAGSIDSKVWSEPLEGIRVTVSDLCVKGPNRVAIT